VFMRFSTDSRYVPLKKKSLMTMAHKEIQLKDFYEQFC
jgi:hypothetical protein